MRFYLKSHISHFWPKIIDLKTNLVGLWVFLTSPPWSQHSIPTLRISFICLTGNIMNNTISFNYWFYKKCENHRLAFFSPKIIDLNRLHAKLDISPFNDKRLSHLEAQNISVLGGFHFFWDWTFNYASPTW